MNSNPHVNTFCRLSLLSLAISLVGCAGGSFSSNSPTQASQGLPMAPEAVATAGKDVIRVGDKVTMRLYGVPDDGWILEVQIPQSGDITVPLLTQSFHADGLAPAELANQIAAAYKNGKLYTNPLVSVLQEERYVIMGGDVRGPTRLSYTPDLTLMGAINACGGFTDYANRSAVRIIRGQQVITVDCVLANKTPGADPRLFPGDSVYVPRTVF